ncbi:xanthine dehydrogenase molybdopterin binding subunit [Rhodobacteraceae bacterium 2CG4]|uniref:Xanthine dehydrogenase molybdopterin binding subunit n=1 Tax=Halovulum marinum TaxID=2662447 RepID=A0A6L5Z3P0_9RHOB|nr:xanthine dehydrogenase molybdopterin binding subunit [Halovulum marinum]MSU91147.1 xanthine dehydrogenase molybdopterin binding subunit [Halovulum marinum]
MSAGKPSPHDSAALHVTGRARYTDDVPLPADTVHLCFGLSPEARGRLNGLDLAAVRAAPGVIDVLTAADLPFANDVSPAPAPEPLLATDRVHFVGQPLFLVIADSHLAARRAARLGTPEISEDPPILTIEDALERGAPELEPPLTFAQGDAEAALPRAPRRLQGSIHIGGQEHFYLEGQAALAMPGDAGDVTVHCSTQHPSEIQHKVAGALGLPYALVRVETRRMGGGFGGKESQGNALAVACAIAAIRTGRPARMRYDRDDDMVITGKRHDFRIDYDVGYDDAGRIAALDVVQYCRCGWSQDLSLPVADRAMLHADNAYHLPHVRIRSHRLVTNTQSATAFRGFGGPQGMVGIERIVDHVAHALGRDPLKVRRANYYRDSDADAPAPEADTPTPTDLPGDEASRGMTGAVPEPAVHTPATDLQTTPYHMPVEDCIINALTDRLAETSDYVARRAAIEAANAGSPVLKRGIALTPVKFGISFTLTHLNQAGALVHVYTDGSIHLNHGGTEMGQGLNTKVAQVAARVFEQPLEAVRITATDTGKVPNTSATAASSGSDLNGMACKAACETIRQRLVAFAAERWQTEAARVRFTPEGVEIGDEVLSFKDLVQAAYMARVSLSATGFYATPKVVWDRRAGKGRPFYYFAYGAAVTEVAIDTLTGENRILRTDILHDCGASLNPAIDIGQIEGGYVQGAGWLTMEELVWTPDGRLATHAPSTYKIPACADRPRAFNVALWDGENRERTIYRSKAVGEPPLMLGISALMALSHAVSQCGDGSVYPALDAPATPERILRAVDRMRGEPWGAE